MNFPLRAGHAFGNVRVVNGIPSNVQEYLQRNQPALWRVLEGHRSEGRVQVQSAAGGESILMVQGEDSTTRALHNPDAPIVDAERWGEAQQVPDDAVVFLIGVGLGYHVVAFAKRNLGRIAKLVLIEPDLDVLTASFALSEWPEPLVSGKTIWLGGLPEQIDADLASIAADLAEHQAVVLQYEPTFDSVPSAARRWEREVEPCVERLRASYMGLLIRGAQAQRNIYANLPQVLSAHPLDHLRGLAKGHPGFVIGGGPSLDKNIGRLSEAAKRGPVIAVDTALRSLLEQGIEPDIVVTRDPTRACYRKLADLEFPAETLLAFHVESYPENPHCALADRRVWIGDGFTTLIGAVAKAQKSREQLTRTTNVGHLALCTAKVLGCEPIVLVGMDLALGEEHGQTHVTGAPYASHSKTTANGVNIEIDGPRGVERVRYETVDGWDGKPLRTLAQFKRYLHHLEKEIQSTPARVIDATEGGAEKRGASPMSLADVLEEQGEPEHERPRLALKLRKIPTYKSTLSKLNSLLRKAIKLQEQGREGLRWLHEEAGGQVAHATAEELDALQDALATPWMAIYESEVFRTVAGHAGGRLTHRVSRTNPAPFRSVQEGLGWLRTTYISFLEEALDLLEEYTGQLERALAASRGEDDS